ncbi:hypothetical protein CHLNCDRAFT_58851 [Chlorella variabilis]|uniref:Metallo-beta-lactamase domain-containing protein n=1 Tax=Chlorella variabilis TaxID=554065 RepID=E1ZP44_CHLVA|nr:hypothetical protein CHLNCDRAFT_58851 [Chlorella variabilis]EFN52382.1 hypothetical protein CHLNCDRAFT_58851 [Chlorella variabilis]|eukprot:XP_005844484.1 hypothetical protein CHLNCDRAFT_58851 [Chlorella variabilis]
MNRRTLLLAAAVGLAAVLLGSAALPAVGGVLGAWRLSTVGYRLMNLVGSGRFELVHGVKKDVYRLDLWWRPLPVLLLPVSAVLVKEGGGWVLVDAGAPDSWSQAYASRLVQAVQQTVSSTKGGGLKAILLTHGHADHVGALPQLLQHFPEVPVVLHSGEAPFLLGGEEYLPPSSRLQYLLRALSMVPHSPVKLPESRVALLHGTEGGSLRQHGISSLRQASAVLTGRLRSDTLAALLLVAPSWIATPGHTPGHMSFLHHPSGTLLGGDALFNMLPSFSWASGIEALVTRPLGWAARLSFAPAMAALARLWEGALPAVKATLGALGLGQLGPRTKAVLQSSAVGQELGTYRIIRLLPGVTVRISPSIVCLGPHCDVERAQASVCALSKLNFRCLLPMHDATGKGLSAADWNATGTYVNYPFGSQYPPYVIRTVEGDAPDTIVLVSDFDGSSYTLSAYDAATGAVNYTFSVAVPDSSNSVLSTLTSGVPPMQQHNNTLSLLFMQIGTVVVAVDPASGQQLWSHPTYNQTMPKITGYSGPDGATVYLTSSFIDTTRAVPTPVNYIEALDAATGVVRWANSTPPPPTSGLPNSDTAAAHGVTALPDMAVYAQGQRMYALSAANGSQLWSMVVTTGSSYGAAAANISSITYVEAGAPPAGSPYPLLLLQSTTWEQTRFIAYKLNGSAGAPPTVAWQNRGNQDFEGSLNDGLARLGLQVPSVSLIDGVFVFWSNRTSYDLTNGGKPFYSTWLVGRSVLNGGVMWTKSMNASGWSQLPVSRPTVHLGVASLVTGSQVVVMEAGSGSTRFVYSAAPSDPQSSGGPYSYVPITTFANNMGQLAAVRCLGSDEHGSLCMYNGYDKPMPSAAGRRRLAGAHAAAAAAALAAAAWLVL